MKIRVLTFGINAAHEHITPVANVLTDTCISDFDAFVFDTSAVADSLRSSGRPNNAVLSSVTDNSAMVRTVLYRHVGEANELLQKKGGVVIALMDENNLRLHAEYNHQGSTKRAEFGPYFLIEDILNSIGKRELSKSIIGGEGDRIQVSTSTPCNYLRTLKGSLRYFARFPSSQASSFDSVLATDSVGHIVAGELKVGSGSMIFLPKTTSNDRIRVGAAIVQTVRERLANEAPDVTPTWVHSITVPGSEAHDEELRQLREQQRTLTHEIAELEAAKAILLNHNRLLYTTGKNVLEPAVRNAFRVIGFEVLDPDSYDGEWDLEMRSPDGTLFIGEVEGPEGSVDIDKFRQALTYHTDQVVADRPNKGLLVGNAHRLTRPEERPGFFTDHAVRASEPMRMALIPTTALFAAVCDVLANNDSDLQEAIRESITNCVGVWQWPPEQSHTEEPNELPALPPSDKQSEA